MGTLVGRTTCFTMLLHLPRLAGYGQEARVKNVPALAGQGVEAVHDAVESSIRTLPEELRCTLIWDEDAEMARHHELRFEMGLQGHFCDPHSPLQRGTNENTNGLLRQYFPKGIDPSRFAAKELSAVTTILNARPRKALG